LYAPSVIEPALYAKGANWEYRPGTAGWGRYEDVLDSIEQAIGEGPYLLVSPLSATSALAAAMRATLRGLSRAATRASDAA
jgi:glutathione S-transferase